MLELEIVPERSIGCEQWEFILGMHFSQAVAIIQSQVGIIKGVQVLYSESNPLGVDLVIILPLDGIKLIFDPIVQRLKIIEIYNMTLVKLKYCGFPFNSPEVLPSIQQIEHSFGATHPGVYEPETHRFRLNFRGLSFCFPVESKFEVLKNRVYREKGLTIESQMQIFIVYIKEHEVDKTKEVDKEKDVDDKEKDVDDKKKEKPFYTHGLGSLQFSTGSSPVADNTRLYSGSVGETKAPPLPLSCYQNHLYCEKAQVIRDSRSTQGLRLHLVSHGTRLEGEARRHTFNCDIYFGDTCQDVSGMLGAPSRLFYKNEDKMKIHSPNSHSRVISNRADYFYNYFTLGIDILFDARTHKVKKFILHTNFPGHYNFNIYHRCEFELSLPPDTRSKIEPSSRLVDVSPLPVTISAYTKWDSISQQLKPSDRPVVLNRACSINTKNPFGSTFCYGYQDIIFEVMPNNYIASITLYESERGAQLARDV